MAQPNLGTPTYVHMHHLTKFNCKGLSIDHNVPEDRFCTKESSWHRLAGTQVPIDSYILITYIRYVRCVAASKFLFKPIESYLTHKRFQKIYYLNDFCKEAGPQLHLGNAENSAFLVLLAGVLQLFPSMSSSEYAQLT